MIKSKKHTPIIAFIVLAIAVLYIYPKQRDEVLKKSLNDEFDYNLSLVKKVKIKHLPKDAILTRWVNDSTTIKNIINEKNSYILIFRIPKRSCTSCIHREFDLLKNHQGIKAFLPIKVITDITVFRDFLLFANYSKDENIEIFNCNDKLTYLDNIGKPYYILLNKSLRIQEIFITVKSEGKLSENFLDKISALS